MSNHHIDICFSPDLYNHYHRDGNLVVVIDIFRATTVIITALANGAQSIIPVADIDSALQYRKQGCLIAGERNGDKLDDFDFGNSPLEFTKEKVFRETIAMTTTNGTRAFAAAQNQHCIAASLLNYHAVMSYIRQCKTDVLFLCSGWTMKMNIEDSLLAGSFVEDLLADASFYSDSDSIAIARSMLKSANDNWFDYILKSSPRLRSKEFDLRKDMEWAMQKDYTDVVPLLQNERLVIV